MFPWFLLLFNRLYFMLILHFLQNRQFSSRLVFTNPENANQTSVSSDGEATDTLTSISGWVFVGVLLGFIFLSTLVCLPFRRQTRRYVSIISVILRTPFSVFRVVQSTWRIVETPSFYRGLDALWVIAGLVLITAYQSDVFVTEGVATQADVQPGSRFTSGQPATSATTNVSLTIVLFQTPNSCDPSQFTLEIVATATTSSGSLTGIPDCIEDSTLPSVNLTFTFPAPLSVTSTSSVSLMVTSTSGSPLFSHGVYYMILLENYDGSYSQITETLTNDPANQVTGDVAISFSSVPTESIDEDGNMLKTGYLFSYFSSSAPAVSVPSSPTLQVSFGLSVP